MGGGSNSKSKSTSSTKYRTTTTLNPYVTSKTTNSGTVTSLAPNTALSSVYDFTNQNIGNLLNEYINPTVDSATNQAKLNLFQKTLGDQTRTNLENNIITPLTERNMIRSSQATNMYNNLANKNQETINDYTTNLLADSQNNTGQIVNNLLNMALQGYNVVSGNQAQSLNTSSGNATTKTSGSSNSARYGM